jgi:hypothetical protein
LGFDAVQAASESRTAVPGQTLGAATSGSSLLSATARECGGRHDPVLHQVLDVVVVHDDLPRM